MMKKWIFAAFCAALAVQSSGGGADAKMLKPLTLAQLERSTPVMALGVCPQSLARPGVFCRILVGRYKLNVFAFAAAGDRPLVAVASYDLNELDILAQSVPEALGETPPPDARRDGAMFSDVR